MKGKTIAFLLCLVLVSGSICNVHAFAAETIEQKTEPVQEEDTTQQEAEPVRVKNDAMEQEDNSSQEEQPADGTATEDAAMDVIEENLFQDNEEQLDRIVDFTEQGTEPDKAIYGKEEDDISDEAAADEINAEIAAENNDTQTDIRVSGSWGENASWTLTYTGILTISGRGKIEHSRAPWIFQYPGDYYVKAIVVEEGITAIGNSAFSSLENVSSITFPTSINDIGQSAFDGCNDLVSITIPDGVTRIENRTFMGCSNLKSISIPNSVTSIGQEAFEDCHSLVSFTIPDGVTIIEDRTFAWCSNLKSITIPNSVTIIGQSAFEDCRSLENITIPDSVTTIEPGSFVYCTSLKSIIIPNSVTSVGQAAFENCKSLNSVTIPSSVTNIGSYAFINCSSLKDVTFLNSMTSIVEGAFEGCSSLESITIPNTVTCIEKGAFKGCISLENISIPDSVRRIESEAFADCSSLTNITIPDSVTTIGSSAFKDCSILKNIVIPDSVTTIGSHAFSKCSNLAEITLPRNIKVIGENAFENCDNLTAKVKNKYGLNYCYVNEILYIDCSSIEMKLTSYNGSDVKVTITKRDDASGYQIKYADNSSMIEAKSAMLKGSNNLSKVITGLTSGKIYYVKVQSYQTIRGTTYWSNWSTAQRITIAQTPYPTNISKLSTYIGSHIKVDWPKTAGASGYHIKYADNSSMANAKEVMIKGNSTFTKTLTGLKNGKTYYVKIQTYRTVSGKTYWSSWSKAKSIKVDQIPYGSSISKLTNPSSKAMKITWDKAPSATGYHIQYSANSSMTGAKDIYINNNVTLSKTVNSLTKGKTYYVRIQTFRKVSGKTYWSSWSKPKQGKLTK